MEAINNKLVLTLYKLADGPHISNTITFTDDIILGDLMLAIFQQNIAGFGTIEQLFDFDFFHTYQSIYEKDLLLSVQSNFPLLQLGAHKTLAFVANRVSYGNSIAIKKQIYRAWMRYALMYHLTWLIRAIPLEHHDLLSKIIDQPRDIDFADVADIIFHYSEKEDFPELVRRMARIIVIRNARISAIQAMKLEEFIRKVVLHVDKNLLLHLIYSHVVDKDQLHLGKSVQGIYYNKGTYTLKLTTNEANILTKLLQW